MYSAKFWDKRVLVLGHMTEIYGPVQALMGYSERNMGKLVSVLHPLPYAAVSNSEFKIIVKGMCKKTEYTRNLRLPGFFFYIQHVFLSFWFVTQTRERYDLCVGIDNLNAFCGLILRQIGIVNRVAFYVIDYTPKRFSNPILNLLYHFLDKVCSRHSDYVWNISERIAQIRETQGVAKRKNLVVPVGIELEKIRHVSGRSINRKALVFVSHLAKSKGVELVISAMGDVVREVPDARLEVIGSGPYEHKLKELVKALGLGDCIKFSGLMQHDELMAYLPTLGVALATYMDDPNNISYFADPTKVKEYLACGLPVVITRVPWIAKEIEEKPMGVAINYDRNELVTAIVRLLEDDCFFEECKENAKAFASELSWDKIFDKAFYESLRM
jgi:glycosyltransferase involved in cell wall biosynthesis